MREELLWKSDLGDGTYKNPVLFADYSDPDVIRAGDTYYMTASSFNYTPGLPILISKDLVNWKLANYAVENIACDGFRIPAHAKGIWAPAIRFHHNRFWIYYGMPDEGIFMVNSKDPLGRWSTPVCVLGGKGLIDPCPFWEEDGKAYIIHGYANSRIGFKSILGMFPMSGDGRKAAGEDEFIYDGRKTQPTIEGPKVYKRDGYYYIFAPAGGVKTGWQTVLRGKDIHGPYEERIVMTSGKTGINGPHQGGLTDTPDGTEWFLHFQDRGAYGRIVHLQPVRWRDGWPVIGEDPGGTGCGEPVSIWEKPVVIGKKPGSEYKEAMVMGKRPVPEDERFVWMSKKAVSREEKVVVKGKKPAPEGERSGEDSEYSSTYLQASDDFKEDSLSLQWQWFGNHEKSFYSLKERKSFLRLYSLNPSGDDLVTLWRSANVLTEKIVCPSFQTEAALDVRGLKEEEQAGMALIGGQYAYVAIRKKEKCFTLVYVESEGEEEIRVEKVLMEKEIPETIERVRIRIVVEENKDEPIARFSYRLNEDEYAETGHKFIPSKHTWVGAKIGLFSLPLCKKENYGYADFDSIKVEL